VNDAAEVTLYIALVASAIVAGGQLFCMLAVIPAFGDWSPRMGVAVHQSALSERPHRYLRVVSALTFLFALATIAIEHSTDTEIILTAIAAVLSIFNGIYSRREWPINHEIDSYGQSPTEEQVANFGSLRRRWDEQHRVRATASLLALALFAAAATFF
jgi:murein tripeptide amidase MpaA